MQDQTQIPLPQQAPAAPVVKCRDCHRPLTDHTSRTYGRGPGCRHKHGLHQRRRTDDHQVDQDQIPGT